MSIGYSKKYPLWIFFQKKVEIETVTGELIRVYGKLNKDNHIYLTDWNEPWLTEQNAYGLEMSKDFYESLIIHEVAHFIAEKIAGRKIENTLSEYIAYVVQLSQMLPTMRQEILGQRHLTAFKTEEINLDIMMFDPVIFGVKSYLHFMQSRGQYLKEILSDAITEPGSIAYWQFH